MYFYGFIPQYLKPSSNATLAMGLRIAFPTRLLVIVVVVGVRLFINPSPLLSESYPLEKLNVNRDRCHEIASIWAVNGIESIAP